MLIKMKNMVEENFHHYASISKLNFVSKLAKILKYSKI